MPINQFCIHDGLAYLQRAIFHLTEKLAKDKWTEFYGDTDAINILALSMRNILA